MSDKDAWDNKTPVENKPEAKSINATWGNLSLRVLGGFILYSLFAHIYNPAESAQGNLPLLNKLIISAFTYAIDFFVVFIFLAIIFTAFGKAVPKFRKLTIPTLLNKALIVTLIIGGALIYGGHYTLTH